MAYLLAFIVIAVVAALFIWATIAAWHTLRQLNDTRKKAQAADKARKATECQHYWSPWAEPTPSGLQTRNCNTCNLQETRRV